MTFCTCNFFSKSLKNHVSVNVLIPSLPDNSCLHADYDEIYPSGRLHKTLYLLHGALDDYSCWMRHTAIERYAEEKGIAVVMPSGQNGFYSDAKYGLDYFTFITEELPRFVQGTFHLSPRREDNFIAGPSMGGYGASKCALSRPDLYAAFADLSGAVDPGMLEPRMTAMGFDFFRYDLIFGGADKVAGTKDDLYRLAGALKDAPVKPSAWVFCGLEDVTNYDMNRRFYDTLRAAGVPAVFHDGHGGHDWPYWDSCIATFLKELTI